MVIAILEVAAAVKAALRLEAVLLDLVLTLAEAVAVNEKNFC